MLSQLIPTKTEAYRVREENTIEPQDRLREYCELVSFMDHRTHEIFPEDLYIPGPTIQSTYAYWGLSPAGGRSASDLAVFTYFINREMKWLMEQGGARAVRPYLDNVAALGWNSTINSIRLQVQYVEGTVTAEELIANSEARCAATYGRCDCPVDPDRFGICEDCGKFRVSQPRP